MALRESRESVLCPVCGHRIVLHPWRRKLRDPLADEICPCCNIHFNYDDLGGSGLEGTKEEIYARWRKWWIRFRMPWVHTREGPPPNWNPVEQLKQIGIDLYRAEDDD